LTKKLDFSDLKRVGRKHKVVYTVIEPTLGSDPSLARWPKEPAPPVSGGVPVRVRPSWRVNKRPYLPTKSIIIDLKKVKKQLWNDLSTNAKRILNKKSTMVRTIGLKDKSSFSCHSESSRGIPFNCKATSQRDLSTRRLGRDDKGERLGRDDSMGRLGRDDSMGRLGRDDKEGRIEFYEAWKKSSKTWVMSEKRFNKLLNAFGNKASLWVSESKGKFLSGILLLESNDTANYFQTWTSERGRKLGAHYHLVWQVILECKKRGLKWFDFEGILDKRWPTKKWAGFSEFKKKFGGKVITYPGSFIRWF